MACWTSSRAPSHEEMSFPLTTASPPAALISATTCSAGDSPTFDPSRPAPRSLTTTLAPSAAKASACSRPIPRPATVTMTTRPSQIPMVLLLVRGWSVLVVGGGRREERGFLAAAVDQQLGPGDVRGQGRGQECRGLADVPRVRHPAHRDRRVDGRHTV